MIYQKIAKFTLSALLLTATGSAYAQETEPQVVTLKDGTTKITWSDFVNAINNPSAIKGTADRSELEKAEKAYETDSIALVDAETAYTTAEAKLADWQRKQNSLTGELTSLNSALVIANSSTEMVAAKWLQDANSALEAFQKSYDAQANSDFIYYKITTTSQGTSREKSTLTISFNFDSKTNAESEGYTQANQDEYYTLIDGEEAKKINSVKVYFGKNSNSQYNYSISNTGDIVTSYKYNASDEDRSYIMLQDVATAIANLYSNSFCTEPKNKAEREKLTEQIKEKQTELDDCTQKITDYTEQQQTWEDDQTTATEQAHLKALYEAAQKKASASELTRDREKTAYDKAVADASTTAQANYREATLIQDVTTDQTITEDFTGTIYGGGKVITVTGEKSLFKKFDGTLANIAINGKVFQAQGNNASYTNVAYWDGSTGAFRDDNHTRTEYNTLGKLGFAVRDQFGVDFTSEQLAWLEDKSKVYSITEYKPNSKQQFYAQTRDNAKFFTENGNEYSIADNMFVESATADLANNTTYSNVIFDGKCKNVVIKETKDKDGFYCPMDITAANVTYDRTFKQGMNALCLPFDVYCTETNKIHDNVTAVCTFDKETSDKFWFKKVAGTIPANTPVLMTVGDGGDFKLEEMQNVTLKKTETQMVVDEGDADDPSKSYGLFMPAKRDQFKGGSSESYKVYGLSGSTFKVASENAVFSAFRMVLYSALAQPTGAMAAPRRIGIVDEKGIEITDELTAGIENVNTVEENDAPSLDITTGVGEINITSEADYGRVTIYTLDGKVAAMADVVAGTTTVNVQHGVYIVMGKKVMVK